MDNHLDPQVHHLDMIILSICSSETKRAAEVLHGILWKVHGIITLLLFTHSVILAVVIVPSHGNVIAKCLAGQCMSQSCLW